jgi:hypothetical protein
VTTKTTLRVAEEGSLLRMLAEGAGGGGIPFKRDARGAYIIDRSEKHFHRVLDFLRSGPEAFAPPRGSADRDELLTEARFYGLDCLELVIFDQRVVRQGARKNSNVQTRAREPGWPRRARPRSDFI